MGYMDNLNLIGTTKLLDIGTVDKYQAYFEFLNYNNELYFCGRILKMMKETVIDYDELSDKIFILGLYKQLKYNKRDYYIIKYKVNTMEDE